MMTSGGAGSDTSHGHALLSPHEAAARTSHQDGTGMKSSASTAGGQGLAPGLGLGHGASSGGLGPVSSTPLIGPGGSSGGISNVVPVNDHMGDVRLVEVTTQLSIHSVNTPFDTLYQPTLSTHPINPISQPTIPSTHPLHPTPPLNNRTRSGKDGGRSKLDHNTVAPKN